MLPPITTRDAEAFASRPPPLSFLQQRSQNRAREQPESSPSREQRQTSAKIPLHLFNGLGSQGGVAIMRDVFELVSRFRERAAECVRLAELSTDHDLRCDYCHVASCYLLLAENELRRAQSSHLSTASGASDRFAILSQMSAVRVSNEPALSSDTSEANSRHSPARCRQRSPVISPDRSRKS
jgi:hypothetical protein